MDKRDKEELFGCLGTILVFVAIALAIVAYAYFKDKVVEGNSFKYEVVEKHKLIAIQNSSYSDSKLNGIFFVMVGSVSGSSNRNDVVYVYEETNSGTFKMNKYSYEDVEFKFIKQNEIPFIERFYKVRIDKVFKYDGTLIETTKFYKGWSSYQTGELRDAKSFYILHVPKESIVSTFDLNIENMK